MSNLFNLSTYPPELPVLYILRWLIYRRPPIGCSLFRVRLGLFLERPEPLQSPVQYRLVKHRHIVTG